MDAQAEHINEALLSYAYAWMRKAMDDNIPGAPPAFLHPIPYTLSSKPSALCNLCVGALQSARFRHFHGQTLRVVPWPVSRGTTRDPGREIHEAPKPWRPGP